MSSRRAIHAARAAALRLQSALGPSIPRPGCTTVTPSAYRCLEKLCSEASVPAGARSIPILQPNVATSVAQPFRIVQRTYTAAAAADLPPHQEIGMPSLSPTMTQGNIAKWSKAVGDPVTAGDVLCEIETDKATLSMESMEDGFLANILLPEGSKDIPVGTPIAVMVDDADSIPAFASYTPGSAPAAAAPPAPPAPAAPTPASEASSPPPSDLPPHQAVGMPSLSPTMTQGNVAKWKKAVGDAVASGDVLCEIETDKATLDMESMEEGFVARILYDDGSKDIPVGTPICILVEDAADIPKFANFTPGTSPAGPAAAAAPAAATPPPPPPPVTPGPAAPTPAAPKRTPSTGRVLASPAARKAAQELKVDLAVVVGTGPEGRIIKADVEEYAQSPAAQQAAAPAALAPAISSAALRQYVAARMVQSVQTVPHYYLALDARVDPISKLLSALNAVQTAKKGPEITLEHVLIKAAALASKKVPECNSSWAGDFIHQFDNVDLTLSVYTEFGLVNPVLKDADTKGLAAIAAEVTRLTEAANSNQLAPEDTAGGTFSFSSVGAYGLKSCSSVINPPQACIVTVGATQSRLVIGKAPGEFESEAYVSATLSCDHRVVDGAVGAEWLAAFKAYIEDPVTLLL